MDATEAFLTLGISLLLGLIVGLQRERVAQRLGGVRTFPLITLLGTVAAMLADPFGGWIVAAGFLGIVVATLAANLAMLNTDQSKPGMTTQMAMLLMYAVGALLVVAPLTIGAAIAGVVAILLHAKGILHGFARRLGDNDFRAVMQFVLMSCVILPIVPNDTFGPYDVLNPRQIWLMVVLVVGIGLGGYIVYKFLGQTVGVAVSGLIGGLISSTATTVSYARRAVTSHAQLSAATVVIVVASTMMYIRILTEIAVVAPQHFSMIAPPVFAMLSGSIVVSVIVWLRSRRQKTDLPEQENPSELKTALVFGVVYATVLFISAAAQEHIGQRGVYYVAAISGLADMDAITISSSRLVDQGRLEPATAWTAIIIASISNMIFKTAIIFSLAGRALGTRVAGCFAALTALGIALILFWPR